MISSRANPDDLMNTSSGQVSPLRDAPTGSCQTLNGNKIKATSIAIATDSSLNLQRPDLQNATSTTSYEAENDILPTIPSAKVPCISTDPAEWSVDDVMRYLTSVDSGLSVHTQLFQKHVRNSQLLYVPVLYVIPCILNIFWQEIDGKALLLLTSDMMMKYMGLKLGPSLKICNSINRLKGRRHVTI